MLPLRNKLWTFRLHTIDSSKRVPDLLYLESTSSYNKAELSLNIYLFQSNFSRKVCYYLPYKAKMGSFPFVPPSLVGTYYLHPQDARAIFLHQDLLCNGTCSATGGRRTYWGGTNRKDPKNYIN